MDKVIVIYDRMFEKVLGVVSCGCNVDTLVNELIDKGEEVSELIDCYDFEIDKAEIREYW